MCIAYDNLVTQNEQEKQGRLLAEKELAERNILLAEKDSLLAESNVLLAERDLKLKLFEQLLKESGRSEEEIQSYLNESLSKLS